MNLQETIFSIFPGCTVAQGTDEYGLIEVSGLTGTMVPQNCVVLASGVFQYAAMERACRSYLVKANKLRLLVRILPDAQNRLCAQITTTSRVAGSASLH
ncbi:MAG: hypothetical protein RJA34_687 [Pseudomonadota bacterium]